MYSKKQVGIAIKEFHRRVEGPQHVFIHKDTGAVIILLKDGFLGLWFITRFGTLEDAQGFRWPMPDDGHLHESKLGRHILKLKLEGYELHTIEDYTNA